MTDLYCPECQIKMESIKEPDIEYEKCSKCNGIYLDEGELNLLAVGHSCNVELSFINLAGKPEYVNKICPKCSNTMTRVTVGQFSFIYFDYCRNCGGYFLDQSKKERLNYYLESITENHSSERFRDYISGVLVRVDVKSSFSAMSASEGSVQTSPQGHNYVIITAYYKEPLYIDLLIVQESVLFKLYKMLFRNRELELSANDPKFNDKFKIHATNEMKMNLCFANATSYIMNFVDKSPRAYSLPGKLTFYDNRVTYSEGPYSDIPVYRHNENFISLMQDLAEISSKIG
jgi:Zn-finger nucleic acid-binding protein